MAQLQPVSPDFVDLAPRRWVFEAPVSASPERVFGALSADPATWKEWFPGFMAGGYQGVPGLGCKRWVLVGGTRYRETMVEWDEPSRWTYRVDKTTVPIARALVERWDVEPAEDGSLVRWTFALDPGVFFKVSGPLAPKVMGRLFRRAMRNLDQRLS